MRALVIEDDEATRELLGTLLTGLGYEVESAGTGEEGVRSLRRCAGGWTVVILDWGLPDLDGAEVLDAIRAASAEVPVLVSSGLGMGGLPPGLVTGPVGFLEKPYGIKQLRGALERLIP